MRSGRLRRCIVAATAATALAVSAIPAQAQTAAPLNIATTAHRHTSATAPPGVGMPLPHAGKGQDTTGLAMCLYNSYDYCSSVDGQVLVVVGEDWKQIGIGVAIALAVILFRHFSGGGGGDGGSYQARVVGYYPKNHGWPTDRCIGVFGYNQHPSLDKCTDKHGIYWQFHCLDSNCSEYYFWNTYSKGVLTWGSPKNKDPIWIHAVTKGDWQKVGSYVAPS